MKILWFTNTPCSAIEKLGEHLNSGGWLRSLEEELKKIPEIELAICYYTYQKHEFFEFKGNAFYPVLKKGRKNKIVRLINRIIPSRDYDKIEVQELLNVINIFKPDLIHIHGTEDNFGLVQYYTKIPAVISIQGILSSYSEKYFVGIPFHIASDYEGKLLKILASGLRLTYNQFKRNTRREQKMLAAAKFIIGRTDWDKRVASILSPQCQYFVGNEILRPAFYSNQWCKKRFSDTLKIVTISGDAMYKGFEVILSSAKILRENTKLKFNWKVLGLDKNSNIVKISVKWKEADLQYLDIELLGSKNANEIVEILLDSDIYCQTSHIENSGNSLCEAMILGMPIIATFAGGTGSLLKDKEEGILIQDGDSFSLAGSIKELSADFSLATQYGQSARKRALIRHEKENIREEYLKIYRKLVLADPSK
jgi:glycosyltransferase involved in cell wall biosynthesis